MGNKKLKSRTEIPSEHKWNIEKMYAADDLWEKDLAAAITGAENYDRFRDHLGDSASMLADALEESDRIELLLERVFVYARMKQDEDNRNSHQQEMLGRAENAIARISSAMSFVLPEIIALPEDRILSFLDNEPRLQIYRHMLLDALRRKAHVLPEAQEKLLAQMSEVLGATGQIFTMLNNADLKFTNVHDEDGDEISLTHGNYINLMRSQNREVRKEAYTACYEAYRSLINTIGTNYSYNVKRDVVSAQIRHYDSARQASLASGNIPESVYDNLISAVNDTLPALHDYLTLRKKILGVDELKMYDVYVPLVSMPERDITFREAVELANKGLAPLGEDYLAQFNRGIEDRWIDIYENEGKTSGAYSFGSYDSDPYVLMNFDGKLEDLFTLVHEMGHSMNSFYTRANQPFCYGDHSIFTAEVASTVNESLMMRYLLENERDPEMHRYILNMYIEAFRTTLFRQTMFAEFEKQTHDYVENGGSLTAEWMNSLYNDLNNRYFGPALTEDSLIQYEWARIPHFYRSFYVYQYATGYSAATAIADSILTKGAPARDAYLEFLKCGTNDYPVELLRIAGVDMDTPGPVDQAMKTFTSLVEELKGLY